MSLSKDRIGALLLLAFSAFYWFHAENIRMLPFQKEAAFNAQTMPLALSVLGVGLALALLVFPGSKDGLSLKGFNWKIGALMLVLMVFYGLTIRPLGFILSTSVFLMVGYYALGERKPLMLILASVPLVVAFWLLMTQGLDIYIEPLPDFLVE